MLILEAKAVSQLMTSQLTLGKIYFLFSVGLNRFG